MQYYFIVIKNTRIDVGEAFHIKKKSKYNSMKRQRLFVDFWLSNPSIFKNEK